ncbi:MULTISPECIES: hypothetical protein [unclassified Kitasatospora]|uniref:hypothetical protein n=1 Tax=unclassified Kitasatospora TaxID=2633591 RepID=UPI00070F8650|nr:MULTISPECIES: hypothetical protein [unclassified Kitasatospora]KQV19524.1 hypothetical protein ASC99_22840 [Kitasatospora sp. Root107]KRB72891.1 hypothetical protein ASE03_21735 [Kitasatospora sp. Root187]
MNSTSDNSSVGGEQADLVAVCAELQGELDALIGGSGNAAAQSLDTAVASLKEVEQRNVSSVQLVALAHR